MFETDSLCDLGRMSEFGKIDGKRGGWLPVEG